MGARVVLGLLLVLASSCARLPGATSSETTSDRATLKRDSITSSSSYIEKVRLTPVELPADRVPFVTQLEVNPATGKLRPHTYTSRGRRATVQLKVDAEGQVTGECGCDAEQAIIANQDRLIHLQHKQSQFLEDSLKETKVRIVEVPVPYTAWYDKVARVLAAVLLAGLLLLLWLYLDHRAARRSQPEQDDGRPI
jgi:hypothetical protein